MILCPNPWQRVFNTLTPAHETFCRAKVRNMANAKAGNKRERL